MRGVNPTSESFFLGWMVYIVVIVVAGIVSIYFIIKKKKHSPSELEQERQRQQAFEKERIFKERAIYNAMLHFSKQYSRIHLLELVEQVKDVGMQETEVEKLLKELIQNKRIPARYDEKTRGIEIEVIGEEIDQLLGTFKKWGDGEKKKK